jgi:hypothetical protein
MIDHPAGTDFLRLDACLASDSTYRSTCTKQNDRFKTAADICAALMTRNGQQHWLIQHRVVPVRFKEITPDKWRISIPVYQDNPEIPLVRVSPGDLLVVSTREYRNGPDLVETLYPMVVCSVELSKLEETRYGCVFHQPYLIAEANQLPGDLATANGVVSQTEPEIF